jgi:inactivated superfamily I helicase
MAIPTWIDLDADRKATVKAKLADRGSKHPATERLATSDAATATAQRLAISVTVFTKKGSTVAFWAKQAGMKVAAVVHDLVAQLEDIQAEQATQLS